MFDGSIVDARLGSKTDAGQFVHNADTRATSRDELIEFLEHEVKACQQVRERLQAKISDLEAEHAEAKAAAEGLIDDAVAAGAKAAKKYREDGPQRYAVQLEKIHGRIQVVLNGRRHYEPLYPKWWPQECKDAMQAAAEASSLLRQMQQTERWLRKNVDERQEYLESWIDELRSRKSPLQADREPSDSERMAKAVEALDLSAEQAALEDALVEAGTKREKAEAKVAELVEVAREVSNLLAEHDQAVLDVALRFQEMEYRKRQARWDALDYPKDWNQVPGWNKPTGRPGLDAVQLMRSEHDECRHIMAQAKFDRYNTPGLYRILRTMLG